MAQIDPTVNTGSPHYDFQANTCDNVYCHGNWLLNKTDSPNQWGYSGEIMFGNNFSPVWTGGGAEIECGTCHGLPPQGHISADLDACGGCHSNIVSPDGTIADKARHINGRINILGTERPF
jgi:predicted CxxxxCH...CXXCH cytochrome family protein